MADHNDRQDTLQLLCERFPKTFDMDARRPLKVGIYADLLFAFRDTTISRRSLKQAIKAYTDSTDYQRTIVTGAARIDLTGAAVGIVAAKAEAYAGKQLTKILNKVQSSTSPRPKSRPPSPGDGLSALREAARKRKEVAR
jgi:sRNA-binding protein